MREPIPVRAMQPAVLGGASGLGSSNTHLRFEESTRSNDISNENSHHYDLSASACWGMSETQRLAKLSHRERALVAGKYTKAGLLNTPTKILEFLGELIEFHCTAPDLKKVLGLYGWVEGTMVPLEMLIRVLEDRKLEHLRISNSSDAEVLGAFVSLGGNADRSGTVNSVALLEATEHFDLEELTSLVGSPRSTVKG